MLFRSPLDPNGIITGYFLVVFRMPDQIPLPSPMNVSFDLNSSQLEQEISELHPFTLYTLELQAETSVGLGNITSVVTLTDEAGTHNCVYLLHQSV